jgi:hypothetical protein
MKYWSNKGRFEAEAQELNLLVPSMGKADTFKGEVWRAATKIYYDYFNNGFGNTWLAPAEFLLDNIELPKSVIDILLEHANGNWAGGANYNDQMDLMIDAVVIQLRDCPDRPNQIDMWEYSSVRYHRFAEYQDDAYDHDDEYEDDYQY